MTEKQTTAEDERKRSEPAESGPRRVGEQSDQDTKKGSTPGADVRPAGPGQMDMPPAGWSKTDEEADESFPASDPPGNY